MMMKTKGSHNAMLYEYGWAANGGFIVRDLNGPWAAYFYPSSHGADAARRNMPAAVKRAIKNRDADMRLAGSGNVQAMMDHVRSIRILGEQKTVRVEGRKLISGVAA